MFDFSSLFKEEQKGAGISPTSIRFFGATFVALFLCSVIAAILHRTGAFLFLLKSHGLFNSVLWALLSSFPIFFSCYAGFYLFKIRGYGKILAISGVAAMFACSINNSTVSIALPYIFVAMIFARKIRKMLFTGLMALLFVEFCAEYMLQNIGHELALQYFGDWDYTANPALIFITSAKYALRTLLLCLIAAFMPSGKSLQAADEK